MDEDLASLFARHQTSRIEWDGPLHSLYELPGDVTELSIRFRSATVEPAQGLRLKIRGGSFAIASTVTDDVVLWQDTAAPEVRVGITWKAKGARSIRIWNAWRVNGLTQAWLGNAGMRVEPTERGWLFRCSDGEGRPDFDDLVVEVDVSPTA